MKKYAFTLAETLITLMVIGVVAALTIPALMQSYQDRQLETAKKKAMTTIANGFKLMIANNDGVTDGLPLLQCGDDFNCLSGVFHKSFQIGMDKSKTHDGLVEKYTKSGDSADEAGFKWDDVNYIFTTNDGMTYGYLGGYDVVVDLNGNKAPNKICRDIIKLSFVNGTVKDKKLNSEVGLCEDLDEAIDYASVEECKNIGFIYLPDPIDWFKISYSGNSNCIITHEQLDAVCEAFCKKDGLWYRIGGYTSWNGDATGADMDNIDIPCECIDDTGE